MMYDLAKLGVDEILKCSPEIQKLGQNATSMEEAGNRIVRYLFDHFGNEATGEKHCVLVRFYKALRFDSLEITLRGVARAMAGEYVVAAETRCLTLLATVGVKPEWNSRRASIGHQAIPLPSEEFVLKLPMIAQLVSQLGLDVGNVINPSPSLIVQDRSSYKVFFVPKALGSPFVPAQNDFVVPYHVRSVVGFGGLLSSGDLFAFILFTKVAIDRDVASLFSLLTLSARVALQPLQDRVFSARS